MARRKLTETKESLVESFAEFARFKNIDRATLMSVLEEVFRTMIRKKYGSDENFDVIINVDKGDIQAFREREIVEDGEVEDEATQISLSEALTIDPDVGATYAGRFGGLGASAGGSNSTGAGCVGATSTGSDATIATGTSLACELSGDGL